MTKPPLSDDEAYERLHRALLVLGSEEGATAHADTALKAARKTLTMMQIGIVMVKEKNATDVPE